jgi:hypothetical protein
MRSEYSPTSHSLDAPNPPIIGPARLSGCGARVHGAVACEPPHRVAADPTGGPLPGTSPTRNAAAERRGGVRCPQRHRAGGIRFSWLSYTDDLRALVNLINDPTAATAVCGCACYAGGAYCPTCDVDVDGDGDGGCGRLGCDGARHHRRGVTRYGRCFVQVNTINVSVDTCAPALSTGPPPTSSSGGSPAGRGGGLGSNRGGGRSRAFELVLRDRRVLAHQVWHRDDPGRR